MVINAEYPVSFRSHIGDSDCVIQVTHYRPAVQARLSGRFEDAEEGEPAEFEYIAMCDGKEDKELLSRVTDEDDDRLFAEFEAFLLAQKYDVDF